MSIETGKQYVWTSPDGANDPRNGDTVTVLSNEDAWPEFTPAKLDLLEELFPGFVPARFDDLERPIPVHPDELSEVPA